MRDDAILNRKQSLVKSLVVDVTEDAVECRSRRRYAMLYLVLKLRMRRSECDLCTGIIRMQIGIWIECELIVAEKTGLRWHGRALPS